MAEDGGTRPALSATLTLGRCVMAARRLWIFFRYTRWLLWLATIGYSIEFMIHRDDHMDAFGRLYLTTESLMFALPVAAVFAGCFELMMRDRAGITRQKGDQIGLKR
jgi:hypothetical protein